MSIFTAALALLIVLNIGVLLGFWMCTALRDSAHRNNYVGDRASRDEVLETCF